MLSGREEWMEPSNKLGDFYLLGLEDEMKPKLMRTWLKMGTGI